MAAFMHDGWEHLRILLVNEVLGGRNATGRGHLRCVMYILDQ